MLAFFIENENIFFISKRHIIYAGLTLAATHNCTIQHVLPGFILKYKTAHKFLSYVL